MVHLRLKNCTFLVNWLMFASQFFLLINLLHPHYSSGCTAFRIVRFNRLVVWYQPSAAELLHIHEPRFYTDCSVLRSAAAATSIFKESVRYLHNRCFNVKAHHQANLACKIQSRSLAVKCVSADSGLSVFVLVEMLSPCQV